MSEKSQLETFSVNTKEEVGPAWLVGADSSDLLWRQLWWHLGHVLPGAGLSAPQADSLPRETQSKNIGCSSGSALASHITRTLGASRFTH